MSDENKPHLAEVVNLNAGKRCPDDLPLKLREMADAVERGEITSLICGYVRDDTYETVYGAPITDIIVLACLLQRRGVDKMFMK